MTTPAKPLTADEVAAWRDIATDEPTKGWQPTAVMRLIATIEQQAEQIEKLRSALAEISLGAGPFNRDPMKHAENCIKAMKEAAREALAATEPKP